MINHKLAGLIAIIISIGALFADMYNLLFVVANALGFSYVLLNLKDLLVTRFQFSMLFSSAFYFVIATFLFGPLVIVLPVFIGGPVVLVIRGLGYLILGCFLFTKWNQTSALLRFFIGIILALGITQIHSAVWSFYPSALLVFSVDGLKIYGMIKALLQFAMYLLAGIILLRSTCSHTRAADSLPR